MKGNGLDGSNGSVDDHCIDIYAANLERQGEMGSMEKGREGESSMSKLPQPQIGAQDSAETAVDVVISNGVLENQFAVTPEPKKSLDSNGVSRNFDSVVVGGSVFSKGESRKCDAVAVNLEPKGSLGSNGEACNDSVPKKVVGEGHSSLGELAENGAQTVVVEPEENPVKSADTKTDRIVGAMSSAKKSSLSRSESFADQCRVCQQSAGEDLIDLGCHCRGGLSKAHRSCIDTWFRTKGSNKCEICQQEASNVSPPDPQPSRNYWVWRFDPTFTGSGIAQERQRGCYSPLWVAFSILIGGLLLDVLISISLGVSAVPVNIIIGVLVVLGIGTALRLALECCHELSLRRAVQRANSNSTLGPVGYYPAV